MANLLFPLAAVFLAAAYWMFSAKLSGDLNELLRPEIRYIVCMGLWGFSVFLLAKAGATAGGRNHVDVTDMVLAVLASTVVSVLVIEVFSFLRPSKKTEEVSS